MSDATVPQVGRFAYTVGADRWWWSDEMFALHAIPAGGVVPSREVLLSHVGEQDRDAVRTALTTVEQGGGPFTVWYDLLDLAGEPREVVLCGAADRRDGTVLVSGFLVDTLPVERDRVDRRVSAGLRQAVASHSTIDQAKGALMLVYGIDAQTAFDLLRWCSQHQNVRVATLAERLIAAVCSSGGLPPQTRALMDEVVFQSFADETTPVGNDEGELHLRTVLQHGVPTIVASGPVDLATAGTLTAAIEVLGAEGGTGGDVVIDLREVSHVGSAGVSALASVARRIRTRGGRLRVVVAPDSTLLLAAGHHLDVQVVRDVDDDPRRARREQAGDAGHRDPDNSPDGASAVSP
ncbi:ANTAR domain-containing protein [Cellulomonas sp. DKR-3]|uniref:ANTAR domain-containing protein n=1 Tax=Cellulomonas fulva TaxID=2835530 RepID=A0ABS5U0T8_9CELL|nr:ANTAR domain-containing protein [Cellulomonas fulva]MBT0994985.1 ANTAR domain-containing protein [Cellulomonas fulva]